MPVKKGTTGAKSSSKSGSPKASAAAASGAKQAKPAAKAAKPKPEVTKEPEKTSKVTAAGRAAKRVLTSLFKPAKAEPKAVPAKAAAAKKPASKAPDTPKPEVPKAAAPKAVAVKPTAKQPAPAPRKAPGAKAKEPPVAAYEAKTESEIRAVAPSDVREHFFHEHRPQRTEPGPRDLPAEYGDTKIVLLTRDPDWVFAYWEINDATRAELKIPRAGHNRRIVVRMYNISGRNWPEEVAHYFFDLDVGPYANNWYIKVPEVGCRWCAELGMYDEVGNYLTIARSNIVATPRDRMSDVVDSEWMSVEETFQRLYGASGGYKLKDVEWRGSEAILRHIEKQVKPILRGESVSSGGLFSPGMAPVPAAESAKQFWLQVHTELILYGATEPDAKVTVQGRPVRLNPDGTFSLRFALPDGEQVLPVRAVNHDGDLEQTITPAVKKATR